MTDDTGSPETLAQVLKIDPDAAPTPTTQTSDDMLNQYVRDANNALSAIENVLLDAFDKHVARAQRARDVMRAKIERNRRTNAAAIATVRTSNTLLMHLDEELRAMERDFDEIVRGAADGRV